jgi:4-amino-4-deoxy-L-arabinose transferase-like glycosyltransferase
VGFRSSLLDLKGAVHFLGGERMRWLVLGITAFLILFAQASHSRLTTDPIVYSGIARTMAESGHYLTLKLGEEPYYFKPPLGFWLAALAIKLLGPNVLAVTLFSRLFGLGCVLLTAWLGARLYDSRVGWMSGFVLVTSYVFFEASNTFRLDSALIFGILLSFFGYFSEKKWGPPVFYLGVSIALLAKGPPGLLPLFIVPVHAFLCGERGSWLKNTVHWLTWSPLLLVPLSWWIYLVWTEGMHPLNRLYSELFRAKGGITSHWGSIWSTYVVGFSKVYWPWLPFAAIGAWSAARNLWNPETDRSKRAAAGTLLIWSAVVIASCALKRAQYLRYVILALPAISILSAKAIIDLTGEKIFAWLPGTVAILALMAGIFLACFPPPPASSRSAEYQAMAEILNHRLPPKLSVSMLKLKPKRGKKEPELSRPEKSLGIFYFNRFVQLVSVAEVRENAKNERVTLLMRRGEIRRIRQELPIELLFAGSLHAVAEVSRQP